MMQGNFSFIKEKRNLQAVYKAQTLLNAQ